MLRGEDSMMTYNTSQPLLAPTIQAHPYHYQQYVHSNQHLIPGNPNLNTQRLLFINFNHKNAPHQIQSLSTFAFPSVAQLADLLTAMYFVIQNHKQALRSSHRKYKAINVVMSILTITFIIYSFLYYQFYIFTPPQRFDRFFQILVASLIYCPLALAIVSVNKCIYTERSRQLSEILEYSNGVVSYLDFKQKILNFVDAHGNLMSLRIQRVQVQQINYCLLYEIAEISTGAKIFIIQPKFTLTSPHP